MEKRGEKRVVPPPVTAGLGGDQGGGQGRPVFPLVEKYTSFQEYSEAFMLPLLLHETWEAVSHSWIIVVVVLRPCVTI